ncbi:MAG: hypothetical protein V3W20_15010, partial [Candidatus Neomarinimicrobiota bacterium]
LKYIPNSGSVGSVAITPTGGKDSVYFALTQGLWSQANEQLFPAYDMATGDHILVSNYPDHADTTINNLADLLIDATGATMAGNYFTFVTYIIQNKTGDSSHVVLNLPLGSYSGLSDALLDPQGFKVKTIPYAIQSYAGFVYEITLRHTNPGGGTWTLVQLKDIKGDYPFGGGSSTGVGGGITALTQASDFPNSYAGFAGYLLTVGGLESSTEFVAKDAIPLTDFDSTGFTLTQSQIIGLVDTISDHRTDIDLNSASRHDAVTLSGAYDYITLSGQDIIRGQVDYDTDISNTPATLPTSSTWQDVIDNGTASVTNSIEVGGLLVNNSLAGVNPRVLIEYSATSGNNNSIKISSSLIADRGAYLTYDDFSTFGTYLSNNATHNNAAVQDTARFTSAQSLRLGVSQSQASSGIGFYTDIGLVAGNLFTPSLRYMITSAGDHDFQAGDIATTGTGTFNGLTINYDASVTNPLLWNDTRSGDEREWIVGHGVGGTGLFGFYDNTGANLALRLNDITGDATFSGVVVHDAPTLSTESALLDDIEGATRDGDFATLAIAGVPLTNSYISNVTEASNNITFTGVGSAFNGSIGSIAKTDVANTFTAAQSITTSGASLGITSTSASSPFINFKINSITNAGDITAVSSSLLQVTNATEVRLNTGGKTLKVRDDGIFGVLDAATESNVVYYNTGTNEFTYGAAAGVFSGAKGYHSSTQAITSTPSTIAFNSEEYDTDTYHDNSTNNSRFTVPSTGHYQITISGRFTFDSTAPNNYIIGISKNGGSIRQLNHLLAAGSYSQYSMNVVETFSLSSGDYIEFNLATSEDTTLGSGTESGITLAITKL